MLRFAASILCKPHIINDLHFASSTSTTIVLREYGAVSEFALIDDFFGLVIVAVLIVLVGIFVEKEEAAK